MLNVPMDNFLTVVLISVRIVTITVKIALEKIMISVQNVWKIEEIKTSQWKEFVNAQIKKDESSSGVCGNSQTINSITVTSTAFGIAEVSIAFLIAVVNKKIYLLVKFIDTC